MLAKILITDPLSDIGINQLREANLEVIYKPKLPEDELYSIISDVDGWIIRSGTKISKDIIKHAKKLQIVGRAGVGVDNIDMESASNNGIIVMNVPDGNTISAAEHTLAMISSLSRNIFPGYYGLIKGEWNRHALVGSELRNKNLGVVGLGKIGKEVIKRALSYDMKILGYDPYVNKEQIDENEIKIVDLDYLIKNSDFITLHVPINDSTRNLFDYDTRKLGIGGIDSIKTLNDLNYLLPMKINLNGFSKDLNFIERSINLENLSYNEIEKSVNHDLDHLLHYPAIYPVSLTESKRTSRYGYRIDPFSRQRKFHDGDDFSSQVGVDVFSTANGVIKTSKKYGSFGNYVEIDHGNGYITVYGHLSKRLVKKGQHVIRGQKIGEVGNTGRSTAPHLHYEVQHNNKHLNPSKFYFEINS